MLSRRGSSCLSSFSLVAVLPVLPALAGLPLLARVSPGFAVQVDRSYPTPADALLPLDLAIRLKGIDPWGEHYICTHDFSYYSTGPNRLDEAGLGDDVWVAREGGLVPLLGAWGPCLCVTLSGWALWWKWVVARAFVVQGVSAVLWCLASAIALAVTVCPYGLGASAWLHLETGGLSSIPALTVVLDTCGSCLLIVLGLRAMCSTRDVPVVPGKSAAVIEAQDGAPAQSEKDSGSPR